MPSLRFETFGLAAEVTSEDPEIMAGVPKVLPPGWRLSRGKAVSARFGVTADGTVTLDGTIVAGSPDARSPLLALGRAITHHVAEHAPGLVFVHAGAVAFDGTGIVIPGRSMTGKSTLVAHLVALGATYYSDEYAVVDSKGSILPYPRRVGHRFGSPTWAMRSQLGSLPDPASLPPLRARIIVVTHYEAGARWDPRELSPGEGAMALLDNTVAARSRPGASLQAARHLVAGARVLGGVRGEADSVVEALIALLPGLKP